MPKQTNKQTNCNICSEKIKWIIRVFCLATQFNLFSCPGVLFIYLSAEFCLTSFTSSNPKTTEHNMWCDSCNPCTCSPPCQLRHYSLNINGHHWRKTVHHNWHLGKVCGFNTPVTFHRKVVFFCLFFILSSEKQDFNPLFDQIIKHYFDNMHYSQVQWTEFTSKKAKDTVSNWSPYDHLHVTIAHSDHVTYILTSALVREGPCDASAGSPIFAHHNEL